MAAVEKMEQCAQGAIPEEEEQLIKVAKKLQETLN